MIDGDLRGRAQWPALLQLYRTPVNVVRNENGYLFALTYDADTDWVRNVLAAGGCERRRAGAIQLVLPHLFHDER